MKPKSNYTLRSTYVFYTYKDWSNAKNAIYQWSPSVYDKLVWSAGAENYYVDLYDDLEPAEAEHAASLIREQGGQYLQKETDTSTGSVCPNCGKTLPGKELFCPYCGMRIYNASEEKNTDAKQEVSHLETRSRTPQQQIKRSFRNFKEWEEYWVDTFIENYAYWWYLISEYIEKDDMEGLASMIVCAHQFRSVEDMQRAYLYLLEESEDYGYGNPTQSIYMFEEEAQWIVFVDCCDLPFTLLVADCLGGELIAWSEQYILCPPLPISFDKALDIAKCKNTYLPKKRKRSINNFKSIAQKHLQLKGFKQKPFEDSKAELRSIYIFIKEKDYNDVKDAVWYGNREVYNKINWYGDWGYLNGHDHVWRMDLYDDLTQEEVEWTVGHIREHNGQYYQP